MIIVPYSVHKTSDLSEEGRNILLNDRLPKAKDFHAKGDFVQANDYYERLVAAHYVMQCDEATDELIKESISYSEMAFPTASGRLFKEQVKGEDIGRDIVSRISFLKITKFFDLCDYDYVNNGLFEFPYYPADIIPISK